MCHRAGRTETRLQSRVYGDALLSVNEEVLQAVLDRERNKGDRGKNAHAGNANIDIEADRLEKEEDEEERWRRRGASL